ncbi:hypothetical protein [Sporosarcina sp. E16_8]|uniref:hypothetical protein n=1 Tax=Sporosarcina sp. E16_8 TaxID=2789295 RepID=UPI001A9171D9|nr:hypothetical protein [Sporosarcina sp. E16_8]MBO0586129.1 hypothetical protein [Sporosarcina sp. E16_8]
MEFHVTFSMSNGKEVLQKYDNCSSSEELAKHIQDSVISREGYHKASPGYYGNLFGETYIKTSEIVSYHISLAQN